MFTRFEEYAASSMLGQPDSPPRSQGKLRFGHPWERKVFGLALSLSKAGYFEWEDFRQNLIRSVAQWEAGQCPGQPQWNYYQRFLVALEQTMLEAGVLSPVEIASLASALTAPPPRERPP
jgi:nitrile hydratase accessory protein